jgi:hypothetical protein
MGMYIMFFCGINMFIYRLSCRYVIGFIGLLTHHPAKFASKYQHSGWDCIVTIAYCGDNTCGEVTVLGRSD